MESGNQTPRAALYALVGAVAILIVALTYGAVRGRGTMPRAEPTAVVEEVTVESLQERVKASPQDADAWAMLGDMRVSRGEFGEAVAAFEHATTLAPKAPGYWSALGEARIYASEHDPMPAPALDAFRKAIALDPEDPKARYFLATKKDLDGDHEGAIQDWLALLADTPPGAVWEKDLLRTIEQVGQINKIEVASRIAAIKQPAPIHPAVGTAQPGPSADQIQAAAALTPSQQEEMGRGMVERLEAKLQANPKNLDGWVMLMRSRMALGETAKASTALKAAVAANPGAKAELEAQAKGLGVPSS
jgi:cytochrome c-type biogenesis protein CcmH